jgi:glucose-1-phosphate thymidylyltransferase
MVYFSDNITTLEFKEHVDAFKQEKEAPGCLIIAREEPNPQAFGVAVFAEDGSICDIVEKPADPPSNLAIGGIYMFDEHFWHHLDGAVGQNGDSFSISDITRIYIKAGLAEVLSVGTETWVDCGTPDALLQASQMAKDGKLDPTPHR